MLDKLSIEFAKPLDIEDVLEIENSSFNSDKFSKSQFDYLLTKAKSVFAIIKIKYRVKAYLILSYRSDSKGLRIYSIAVHPLSRGLGLAVKLLDFSIDYAKQNGFTHIHLEVRPDNKSAINLYNKSGFIISGQKKAYYTDGSDAVIMTKNIEST